MTTAPYDNQADIDLFYKDPHAFILRYQETLQVIVKVYIQRGMFRPRDYEDILQTLNVELLRRLPAIQARFKRSTVLRTYLSAVVRNLCIDLYKAGMEDPKVVPLNLIMPLSQPDVAGRYDIEHAKLVFRAVLKQFDYELELPRLLFCLKLRYRIPIEPEDVLKWYPACGREDLSGMLNTLARDYEELKEREISEIITPLLNKADGKSNNPEAIRRWTKERIGNILDLLNGSPPTGSFDEETLEILIEDFFSPFLAKIK